MRVKPSVLIGLPQAIFLFLLATINSRADDWAKVGSLKRDGGWELGVTFSTNVARASRLDLGNYQITSGGGIMGLRFVEADGGVILTATNLTAGAPTQISLTGFKDDGGNALVDSSYSFLPSDLSWTAIGSQELGFAPDAIAVSTNGFDLISGGIQLYGTYDEATFVYEVVTGDFDRAVRVQSQDASSTWARAGLMVRETLDTGKPRPTDPFDEAEAFSRYVEVHMNPVETAEGQPGNNAHEILFRPYTGGIQDEDPDVTHLVPVQNDAPPAYPNAWLRMKREGDTFRMFRGTNGVDWIELGSVTFPTNDFKGPLPATVYVGPSYSPENGNVSLNSGKRAAFKAEFRDYSGAIGGQPRPTLSIRKSNGQVEISWTGGGRLQMAPSLNDPIGWSDVPNATNPYLASPTGTGFFRVVQ